MRKNARASKAFFRERSLPPQACACRRSPYLEEVVTAVGREVERGEGRRRKGERFFFDKRTIEVLSVLFCAPALLRLVSPMRGRGRRGGKTRTIRDSWRAKAVVKVGSGRNETREKREREEPERKGKGKKVTSREI